MIGSAYLREASSLMQMTILPGAEKIYAYKAEDVIGRLHVSELDTTASTGVVYWEGEVEVAGSVEGSPLTGLGYVELTGYGER